MRHKACGINTVERHVLKYVEGQHTEEQIIDLIINHIEQGDLTVRIDEKVVNDSNLLKKTVTEIVKNTINWALDNHLLV